MGPRERPPRSPLPPTKTFPDIHGIETRVQLDCCSIDDAFSSFSFLSPRLSKSRVQPYLRDFTRLLPFRSLSSPIEVRPRIKPRLWFSQGLRYVGCGVVCSFAVPFRLSMNVYLCGQPISKVSLQLSSMPIKRYDRLSSSINPSLCLFYPFLHTSFLVPSGLQTQCGVALLCLSSASFLAHSLPSLSCQNTSLTLLLFLLILPPSRLFPCQLQSVCFSNSLLLFSFSLLSPFTLLYWNFF